MSCEWKHSFSWIDIYFVGKLVSVNNSATSIDIQARTLIQPKYHKGFEKSRVPFKSGSSAWYGPPGSNNNLVISFSDNDSGSDAEDCRQDKTSVPETKGNTVRLGFNKVPTVSLGRNSEMSEQTTGIETKILPRKVPSNHRFIQSTKAKGFNSRNGGQFLPEKGSRIGNFGAPDKNLAKQERDSTQILNNSNIQDLRQQIAIRETKLKLKSAQQTKEAVSQQSKEAVSSISKDNNPMNVNNDTNRKSRSTLIDIQQLEPKERCSKRLKISGTYSRQLNSNLDDRQDTHGAKSLLGLKEPIPQSGRSEMEKIDHGYCEREVPANKTQTSAIKQKKQDENQSAVSMENFCKNGWCIYIFLANTISCYTSEVSGEQGSLWLCRS